MNFIDYKPTQILSFYPNIIKQIVNLTNQFYNNNQEPRILNMSVGQERILYKQIEELKLIEQGEDYINQILEFQPKTIDSNTIILNMVIITNLTPNEIISIS
jgi:hypothetical protein